MQGRHSLLHCSAFALKRNCAHLEQSRNIPLRLFDFAEHSSPLGNGLGTLSLIRLVDSTYNQYRYSPGIFLFFLFFSKRGRHEPNTPLFEGLVDVLITSGMPLCGCRVPGTCVSGSDPSERLTWRHTSRTKATRGALADALKASSTGWRKLAVQW